jgi:hypothetical protein
LITLFFKKDIFPKIYNLYYGTYIKLEKLSSVEYYKDGNVFDRGYRTTNNELIQFMVLTLLFPFLFISFIIIAIIPVCLYCLIVTEFQKYRDSTKKGGNES